MDLFIFANLHRKASNNIPHRTPPRQRLSSIMRCSDRYVRHGRGGGARDERLPAPSGRACFRPARLFRPRMVPRRAPPVSRHCRVGVVQDSYAQPCGSQPHLTLQLSFACGLFQDHHNSEPGKRSGKPCIRGMSRDRAGRSRVPRRVALTEDEILKDFSELNRTHRLQGY